MSAPVDDSPDEPPTGGDRHGTARTLAARARLPRAAIQAAIAHPLRTLLQWGLALLIVAPGQLALTVDTSTDSVLDRNGAAWRFYEISQDLFGGDELIVVSLRSDEPFDPRVLARVERLDDALQGLPGVSRVDSIASLPSIRVNGEGDLELNPAWGGAGNDAAGAARLAAALSATDRILPRSLVSEDGRTFALNLILEAGREAEHAELIEAIHARIDPEGALMSGVPVFRVEANRRTGIEILTFAPMTAIVISAFLLWMFRSPLAVLLCAGPGAVGVFFTTAAMGFFDSPLSISTMVLPSTILALGCAYSMHVLTAASGATDPATLERSLSRLALPISLSGLTTAVGFVSLALIRIEVVRATGVFGAIGVLVVTLATLTLVPAILALRPLPVRSPRIVDALRGRVANALVELAMRRNRAIVVVWILVGVGISVGLARVQVETDATQWLPRGQPVRDAYESIREELSGISPMNVVIQAPEGRSVLEPETLSAIDGLTHYLDGQPEVGKAISVADPLRQIHGEFNEDGAHGLPSGRNLAEQYLLLLESVDLMGDIVTRDRREANVMLRVDDNGSAQLMDVAARADAWWDDHGPPDVSAQTTGIMYEFARAEEAIAHGQLRGLAFALAVISMILFAIFRWPRLSLVALVPNTIPLLIIFGCMGLIGVPIDAGTVVMGSLALGIAVDDTIHISTTFYESRSDGHSAREALRSALSEVLPAVVASTLMITLSFGLFTFSDFAITQNLGWLTGGIMVLCLVADLTLLSALLMRLPSPPPRAH